MLTKDGMTKQMDQGSQQELGRQGLWGGEDDSSDRLERAPWPSFRGEGVTSSAFSASEGPAGGGKPAGGPSRIVMMLAAVSAFGQQPSGRQRQGNRLASTFIVLLVIGSQRAGPC